MKIENNVAAQYAALNNVPAKSEPTEVPAQQVLQADTVSLSGANNDEQKQMLENGFGRVPPP